MWDSNLTDEYYVAVHEFNLSWEELVQMAALAQILVRGRADQATPAGRIREASPVLRPAVPENHWASLHDVKPVSYLFMCNHYKICLQ